MFFNGAICAIYMSCGATDDGVTLPHRYDKSIRFGRELGKIVLSLTKTEEEIKADPIANAVRVAKEYGIENIAKLPINPKLAAACDKGMIELSDCKEIKDLADAIIK